MHTIIVIFNVCGTSRYYCVHKSEICYFLLLTVNTSKWRRELEGQTIIVKVILPSSCPLKITTMNVSYDLSINLSEA